MLKEKMSRYKKSILSVCFGLVAMAMSVCFFSLTSEAATGNYYEVNMPCNEPLVDESNGYILVRYSNGQYGLYFWNCMGSLEDTNPFACAVSVRVSSNKIEFGINGDAGLTQAGIRFGLYNATLRNGQIDEYEVYNYLVPDAHIVTINQPSSIVAYTCRGAFKDVCLLDGNVRHDIVVSSWGAQTLMIYKLNDLYDELVEANSKNDDILEKLDLIYNSNLSLEEKLDALIDLENENKTWLQKIWEALTGSDSEKEKIEEEKGKAEEQASQLEGLNEQNKTDKVDPSQAQDSVNGAIDNNQIQNYSVVLSVFTHDSHIGQMMLIVIALTLVSYVLFGKK